MPEPLILAAALVAAGALVLLPLWRQSAADGPAVDDEREAALLRHRVALEALRDVEADRRAGSLDDAAYGEQLAAAELRAAATRAALEHAATEWASATAHGPDRHGRLVAVAAASVIAGALFIGSVMPGTGIANQTVVNQALADAEAAESGRQQRIGDLLEALAEDPGDADTLSTLADEYLAGTREEDLVGAAVALRALIALEPDRADAYERIIAAYLRAGDHENARAAHTTYAALESADPIEIAFLDGIIGLREGQADAARAAFDRFLELAPDDPRAGMVRGLREDAGAEE